MKIKFTLSFFLLLVSVFGVQAVDYYVDKDNGNNRQDGLSAATALHTLARTFALVLQQSEDCSITLIGDNEYTMTTTTIKDGSKILSFAYDLIIKGADVSSKSTLKWDSYFIPNGGSYGDDWYCCGYASNGTRLTFQNLHFNFTGIYQMVSTNVFVTENEGEIIIDNCDFMDVSAIDQDPLHIFSNDGAIRVSNCHFYGVDSVQHVMSGLVNPLADPVFINPFYFTQDMDVAWHIKPGVLADNITFGAPKAGDNIWFTEDYVLGGGRYGVMFIEEGLIVSSSDSIAAIDLHIKDKVRLNIPDLTISDSVHVYGDAFVKTSSDFGNATTTVDLVFPKEVLRYFTPPFDIVASDLGKVESDEDAPGGANSVWLYEYDEKVRSENKNAWKLITNTAHLLNAGRGYCIWSNTTKISLTEEIAYPNLDGGIICDEIAYTVAGEVDSHKGFNYLGNTYSLPLRLPIDNPKIKVYYYVNSAGDYTCMAGDGVVGGSATLTSLTIPSYGAFFLQATAPTCEDFSIDNLETSMMNMKSTSVVQAPQYIRIALQKGDSYDDAVVRFEQDADAGYDNYDAQKIYPKYGTTRSLISTADESSNGDYVIQGLPAIDELGYGEVIELPLHLESASAGVYDVSVSFNNMASGDMNVSLYDKENGSSQALTDESNATVQLPASGKIQGRYSLKVMRSGVVTSLTTAIDKAFRISKTSDHLMVSLNGDDQGIVSLFDISGKLITTSFISTSCQISTRDVVSGVYLVAITTKSGQAYREKVVL